MIEEKQGYWIAKITLAGKEYHLGEFSTGYDANVAVRLARNVYNKYKELPY